MRILPDARDLIDLTEHNVPLTANAFGEYLRSHAHQIVLSFTNVRELAGPLANQGDFLRIRVLLQALEALPHEYIEENPIVGLEIQSAVQAFSDGTEYQPVSPFVTRWDRTIMLLPGQRRAEYDMLVGLRLDEIVYDIFQYQPQVFAPPFERVPQLMKLFEQDRALLRAGKAPTRDHFIIAVKKHAEYHRVNLPPGREDELARWIYANPARCPGLRLN